MHLEGVRAVDVVYTPLRRSGVARLRESVTVLLAHGMLHVGLAVDIHRLTLHQVEGAQFVQSSGVVFMVVRQQHGVQMMDSGAEHLEAEIRTAVHDYRESAVFDEHGSAKTLVARIG